MLIKSVARLRSNRIQAKAIKGENILCCEMVQIYQEYIPVRISNSTTLKYIK